MQEMNFDLIVVNGDSFSDGGGTYEQYKYENNSEPPVSKIGWPFFLSQKLKIPIVNLSTGGTSNRSIINKSIRFLEDDDFYYHRDCSIDGIFDKIDNFNINNYQNILFITQWSYLHRFPFYIKDEYREMSPNMYNGLREEINSDILFEKYKEYADLRFGTIYKEKFNGKNFITDYLLYNTYLSTKKNITHYNWPFVPFQYDTDSKNYFVLEKIKNFKFNLIDKNCIDLDDLKKVREETNGVISDDHYGLNSTKIMADRLIEFLKKDYELQQI
jgi:hypothetical protein